MFTDFTKRISVLVKTNKKLIIALVLGLLIFLSLFPRGVEVLNQNPVFSFDQGRDSLAVRDMVEFHKFTLIGPELGAGSAGLTGIFQGPYYYYLLTIPFILFNASPVGGVYLMFVLSILAIIAGYYLGKIVLGKYWGILFAFLIAICPIFISDARFIWNPHTPPLFIMLTFIFVYKFITEKKNIYVFLAAFFSGFIYGLEFAVSAPLALSVFIFSFYIFRVKLLPYLYMMFGFLLAFSPMIFFEIRHHFIALNGFISYLEKPAQQGGLPPSFYIIDHAKSFIYNVSTTFPLQSYNISLITFIVLVTLGLYFAFKEKNETVKKFIYFLVLLIPVSFTVFYFLKNTVWVYYLTELSVAYLFLTTYITYSLFKRKNNLRIIALIILLALVFSATYSAIKVSKYDYSDYGGTVKLKGKTDALDFIYKDANKKPFGLFAFTPPIYTYATDYLVWWYGKNKYQYLPGLDKKGTFYLLIEKDNEKPWTYQGWLQTVIRIGKVEWTKTLPSGFIVQKRIAD